MTEEQREDRELETAPAEAEASDADQDDEPDFELHGQYFNEPSN
jgi:hypothetical protein